MQTGNDSGGRILKNTEKQGDAKKQKNKEATSNAK